MKISVFIPCAMRHLKYINSVVSSYMNGTRVPDEIVIFVSGMNTYIRLPYFEKVSYCFVPERVLAGPARQKALFLCTGDVVMYQDADDLPARERVEVVERYFNERDIVHLTHSYIFMNKERFQRPREIKEWDGDFIYNHYFPTGRIRDCSSVSIAYGEAPHHQHAGACCIRREILKRVQWKENSALVLAPTNRSKAEDYDFCMETAYRFRKSIMIDAKLYAYRVD